MDLKTPTGNIKYLGDSDFLPAIGGFTTTDRYLINDRYEVCKYRVMFGYRLRAGIYGDMTYDLDICCGPEPAVFESLFYKVVTIILNNPPSQPFLGIPPMSREKPYTNDPEFISIVDNLFEASKKHIYEPEISE